MSEFGPNKGCAQRAIMYSLFAHTFAMGWVMHTQPCFGRRYGKILIFSYPSAGWRRRPAHEVLQRMRTQFTARGRHERTSDDVQSRWYGSRGATWEVNPRRSYHDFDEERRTDPEGVQTRIDCNPPYSKTGFYRSYPDKVRKSFCYPERAAILGYEVVPISHNVQVDGVLEHRTFTGVRLLWAESDDEDRVLGGDPGERSDIFALAIARAEACNRSIDVQRVLRRERIVEGLPGLGERVQERTVHRNVNVRTVDRAVVIDGLIEIVPIPYQRSENMCRNMQTKSSRGHF